MACKVKIPASLRWHTNGAAVVQVEGNYIHEAFDHLQARYPAIGERLFDAQGHIKSHLTVFLNNEDIRFLKELDTPLHDGDTVVLLPALKRG